MIEAAEAELSALLTLRSCRFEAPPYERKLERLERSGTVIPPKQLITVSRFSRHGMELPAAGVELPVLSRGQEVGRFVLEPTPEFGASLEQRVVAVALADQVGAALGTS
ncbi:MAG: Osmosensitive channel histidine kinaselike protein [Acidimicrobiales bacterium]|nr:Osmosensitive channel histidine kinaselike protein [Acidimicrobiales bacterium]